jgi:poly-beta-1,6-N-acetyl-D-glucosamine synthase
MSKRHGAYSGEQKGHDVAAAAALVRERRAEGSVTGPVVALLPAHNEAAGIAQAVASIKTQVDRVVVVADNCTDNTVELAKAGGAEVFETVGNTDKKAGALNQVLATLLLRRKTDYVLVQDADSQLDPGFVECARGHLERRSELGAVGGTFRGDDHPGLLGHLQRNEYARYGRDVRRLKGRCLVVTGTAATFRASTLWEVQAARLRGTIPAGDGQGSVYDTTVLTEDNELTFALLHLGYEVLSPAGCTLVTEVMPTWRQLWNQRLRWKRGAIENCFQYGVTKITWKYWGRQLFTLLGLIVTAVYLGAIGYALGKGQLAIAPLWLGVTGIFMLERVVTLRDRGWKRMLPAVTLYELFYDIFLQVIHAKAYGDALLRRKRTW